MIIALMAILVSFFVAVAELWMFRNALSFPEQSAIALFIAMIDAVAIFLLSRRKLELVKKHGLLCPHCGDSTLTKTAKYVLSTGRCGNCNEILFEPAQFK
jgi:ribosomal protein S27AE